MGLILIQSVVAEPDLQLAVVEVKVDRQKLAKRLWRAVADDGAEIGVEIAKPCRHGQTLHQNATARYVVAQLPEPVLIVSLAVSSSEAAGIGWAIGNLHLELSAEADRLVTPDDPATRQLLERIQVPYDNGMAVFQPGRFVRNPSAGKPASHELGPSHRH